MTRFLIAASIVATVVLGSSFAGAQLAPQVNFNEGHTFYPAEFDGAVDADRDGGTVSSKVLIHNGAGARVEVDVNPDGSVDVEHCSLTLYVEQCDTSSSSSTVAAD